MKKHLSESENNLDLSTPQPIYIISGGRGIPAYNIVQSVLIQFPNNKIPVKIIPDVINIEKLEEALNEVVKSRGIVVHTMVDENIHLELIQKCKEKNIKAIDLMGELFSYLTEILKENPLNQPGLFRKLNLEYLDRIESLEYTISSDDGLNPKSIHDADIILTGISRTGKTPTSIYMAMLGWKVANIPLVQGIDPPEELFKVDPNRVFGLNVKVNQLISHRRKRLQDFGYRDDTDYIIPAAIRKELDYAESIFRKGNFSVINVTNMAIESIANEIIELLSKRFETKLRKK